MSSEESDSTSRVDMGSTSAAGAPVHAAEVAASQEVKEDSAVVKRRIRIRHALIAAHFKMIEVNFHASVLTAVAVAAGVLDYFDVRYKVIGGYREVDGSRQSAPHLWIESVEDATGKKFVTDLYCDIHHTREVTGAAGANSTVSVPGTFAYALGFGIAFQSDYLEVEHSEVPRYTIVTKDAAGRPVPSVEFLRHQGLMLKHVLDSGPPRRDGRKLSEMVRDIVVASTVELSDTEGSITAKLPSSLITGIDA